MWGLLVHLFIQSLPTLDVVPKTKVIIIKIFLKHKILSLETVQSVCVRARAHTHTHTHTHIRTHIHTHTVFLFWVSCCQDRLIYSVQWLHSLICFVSSLNFRIQWSICIIPKEGSFPRLTLTWFFSQKMLRWDSHYVSMLPSLLGSPL